MYVHFGADGTAAVTTDGKVAWKVVLAYQSQHGNGGSPALYEDLLIVNCDGGDEAFVVALDKATGRVRWRTPRRQPFDQSYTTPLVINVAGADQLVSIGAYRATAYEPRTGREIWRVSYGSGFSNVPRPVFGHGLVYIATGFQQPTLLAVRVGGTGDVTRSHVAWTMTQAGAVHAVASAGRRRAVRRQRHRDPLVPRRDDRGRPLDAAARRQLLCLADLCGRPGVLPQRRRHRHRSGARP